LDQKEFLSDEDMQLKLLIENSSGQDIYLGKSNDWITFTVTKDDNSMVSPLGDGEVANEFKVDSARGRTLTFNLTPFFDFRQPGRYTVKAVFKIPQWGKEVSCDPVSFTVINGLRLPMPDFTVGIPPRNGEINAAPEVRRYFLEKVTTPKEMKLYCRLTDATGAKTLRAFPISMMTGFSEPEAQTDQFSNLHVLNQSGGQAYTYVEIDTHGLILERQTYDITGTRPRLHGDTNGGIVVEGGARRVSAGDIPPSP
jgi:hypothetical protein